MHPETDRLDPADNGASLNLSGPRRIAVTVAAAVLLAGPTVLSFFTGGYFDVPREWAGLIGWGLVIVAVAILPRPFALSRPVVLAVGGLALFAAWTLLSTIWAPIAGLAYAAGQLVALYLGVLLAATALLSVHSAQRLAEPVLATGILVVIGYGLSERVLPGLLHFQRSVGAQGRLEQPLTYWNAMGELAAVGIVLAARIAGDASRAPRMRIAAAIAVAPLGMGLYLSFSRGALFACAAGLVALTVVAPRRQQLRAVLLAIATAVLAGIAAAPFSVITTLSGTQSTRERDGLVVLALLLVIGAVGGVIAHRQVAGAAEAALPLPRRAAWIALAVVFVGLAVAIVSGAKENSTSPLSSGASRLTTLQSDRYSYWRVAMNTFGQQPLRGVGAGGWSVAWLRLRPHNVGAQDAHSLPLQTMAELGAVGLILLLVFFGGVTLAARRALTRSPALAAGPIAGVVVYAAHSPLDWDWQMPALTLVAIVLAGLLLALSSAPDEAVAAFLATGRPAT
ncbi:MAG: O-antigen ligase family protein [Actinomycetota bacterium]|nr:O-antigen ligase family protein [Actinomycetota bacterium]